MKTLTTKILACGIIASSLLSASAAPVLRVSADGGATWILVVDNGPLDANPNNGKIVFTGPVGDWDLSISSGQGSPAIGSPNVPDMDLSTINTSTSPATLIAQLCETNLSTFPSETYFLDASIISGGTIYNNVYRDSQSILFGTTATYLGDTIGLSPSPSATLLMAAGPTTGNNSVSNGIVVSSSGSAPNSLTLETIITHNGVASTQVDAHLYAQPQPACNCTLTFNSLVNITNCAGDKIPDATASQDCGSGPTSVPVTVIGAVTNGVCPKIITRTNAAVDSCGNVQTFVQTITVNCKGSVCGHIFADCDGSGDLSSGDVGLSNVVVTLVDSANKVVGTQKTDVSGGYCFTNLAGGIYTAQVTPPSGYSQTAASTSYHWKDCYGRICWGENDGYIHCLSSGTECWWDKSNCSHWKDSYGRDCWKDKYNNTHCQPCSYQSCNAQTYNDKLTITLTNCTALTDVDFAYTGNKAGVSCTVTAPSNVKCGQSCTYTCTVVNNGNVCFTGGKVCHTFGNCNSWGGWGNGCTTVTDNCPPLSPGQSCTFTHKCTYSSSNCGTVGCQSTVTCYQHNGNSCNQSSSCYSNCNRY